MENNRTTYQRGYEEGGQEMMKRVREVKNKPMENKDWKRQFENEFAGWWDYKSAMTERIVDSIESRLKSKQEEIEKAIKSMKKNPKKDIVYCTSYELALEEERERVRDNILGRIVKNSTGFDTVNGKQLWHLDIDAFEADLDTNLKE